MIRRLLPPLVLAFTTLAAGTGCKLLSNPNQGTGSHFDTAPGHEAKSVDSKRRDMVVEVTTDANGDVAQIRFQRSSGKDTIDEYVAETIRQSWPRAPLVKSVATLTYSVDKGFSQPKVLSTTPVAPAAH